MTKTILLLCALLCALSTTAALAQAQNTTTYKIKCNPDIDKALIKKLESFNYHNGNNVVEKEGGESMIVTFSNGKPVSIKKVYSDGTSESAPVTM